MRIARTVVPLALAALALGGSVFALTTLSGRQTAQWSYSELVAHAHGGSVSQVTITGTSAVATASDGTSYAVTLPDQTASLASQLAGDGVDVRYQDQGFLAGLTSLLPTLLIVGAMGALFWWVYRGTQRGSSGGPAAFGRSTARRVTAEQSRVTFADVAGVEEARDEVTELVEFLRTPGKFRRLGARIPKGVLMVGPPGTGKTLLARAVAGEAGVPFFAISGSEFVEMYVGVGASRVRSLFEEARKSSPCLVFVDEIDAVGRQRGAGLGGGNDEREQTLNQLLVEMDGFETDTHVIVIAATNRPDVLDPALLRAGRFDRRVMLDRPDVRGRREILDVHLRNTPLAPGLDIDVIARQTPGFCGADLANLVNEAAILAGREERSAITMPDLEESIARLIAGPERRSMRMSGDEKRTVAYHEAGHALVMKSLPHSDRVRRVSIISRGSALGWTLGLPDEDRHLAGEDQLRAQLAGLMGGRTAEELVFRRVTSGAANDIERATGLARRMVTQWGMSERVGAVAVGASEETVFLGRDLGERRSCSEEMAATIDDEVRRIVDEARATARRVLTERRDALTALAERLMLDETVEEDELDRIAGSGTSPAPLHVMPERPAPGTGTR